MFFLTIKDGFMPIAEDEKYHKKYDSIGGNLTDEDRAQWAKAVSSLTPEELEKFNKELKRRNKK
jgi:gluconate kinase